MRRRPFLRSGLAASLVAIAGCSSTDEETPTDAATGTQSDTPAETPRSTSTPDDETPTEAETATQEETPTQDETTTQEETPTEEEEENSDREDEDKNLDRPEDYRWDIKPGRNNELRNQLGQYVESVGPVRQNHPAFQYSTDQENDDHTVDFEALRMIRDSNFDIFVNFNSRSRAPLEKIVESFTDDSLYEQSKNNLFPSHPDSPTTYDKEAWLNADTVEESLDLGHNLLITIDYDIDENVSVKEDAVAIREAYQRYHDFDVLAWEVPLSDGALSQGMMYSPDDDKIRSFAGSGDWNGEEGTQYHTEIQNWDVISDPSDITDADRYQHPIMFHTDEWNRQGVSFEGAKEDAVGMVFDIATDDYNSYNTNASELNDAIIDNITMTTGATEQLTRTMLEYNESGVDADFSDIRDLASFAVGKYIEDPEINGVIDTVDIDGDEEAPENAEYSEYFDGGFAFYELEDEELVDEVRNDRSHEYDNFAAVFDDLETAA